MNSNPADIRREYLSKSLSESGIQSDPVQQFGEWWNEAITAQIEDVNAMTLATASVDAVPSARIVLLKEFNQNGFVFFTNYNSFKGQQLAENPKACLVFFWKELERQVRITGIVKKVSDEESNIYFKSRPETSQIGALVSPQSQVIANRNWIDEQFKNAVKELKGSVIQRPAHWGGYIVKPVIVEFWQGRPNRLHDRIQYSLEENGTWKIERLAP